MSKKVFFFSLFLASYCFGSALVEVATANAPSCDRVFFLGIPGNKGKIQIPFSSKDTFDQFQMINFKLGSLVLFKVSLHLLSFALMKTSSNRFLRINMKE